MPIKIRTLRKYTKAISTTTGLLSATQTAPTKYISDARRGTFLPSLWGPAPQRSKQSLDPSSCAALVFLLHKGEQHMQMRAHAGTSLPLPRCWRRCPAAQVAHFLLLLVTLVTISSACSLPVVTCSDHFRRVVGTHR